MNRSEFESKLEKNLQDLSGGVAYAFGEMLLPMVLSMLTSVFQSCLGNLTPQQVAEQAVEPNRSQFNQMRIKVCRELYDGKWKDYRADNGDRIVKAIFATTKDAGVDGMVAVLTNTQQTDWSA